MREIASDSPAGICFSSPNTHISLVFREMWDTIEVDR